MPDHVSIRAAASQGDRVIELRQYTLRPRQRDVLIDLFDREFVETQGSVGMRVMGQFRDLDDPNRFVWLRGFADMASRALGLEAFYGGPVWAAHRDAANATMIDSDNVLLLRPAWPGVERGKSVNIAEPGIHLEVHRQIDSFALTLSEANLSTNNRPRKVCQFAALTPRIARRVLIHGGFSSTIFDTDQRAPTPRHEAFDGVDTPFKCPRCRRLYGLGYGATRTPRPLPLNLRRAITRSRCGT
jgi:hypothetical protein